MRKFYIQIFTDFSWNILVNRENFNEFEKNGENQKEGCIHMGESIVLEIIAIPVAILSLVVNVFVFG